MKTTQFVMGNVAAAWGALSAGVNVVCGYPGTPSTELLEEAARFVKDGVATGSISESDAPHVEWSINEKAALEVAFGASISGARALVTMKQVGLNVAADPLLTIATLGIKGGLVLYVADDPGPISSQTEQDTRQFAQFAKVPVLDASTPEDLFLMAQEAFELSERHALPVIVRATTRVCHGSAALAGPPVYKAHKIDGFEKSPEWVIFPPLAYKAHASQAQRFLALAEDSSFVGHNQIKRASKPHELGFVAGGISWAYLVDALDQLGLSEQFDIYKLAAPFPFNDEQAAAFLAEHNTILVFEELEAVIERELLRIAGSKKLPTVVRGRLSGDTALAGENSIATIAAVLCSVLGIENPLAKAPVVDPELLVPRPPVLCAGCPHRASFYAVKKALRGKKATYSGDIGCYTLGNALPLNMTDTCVCMGAGFTVPQGMHWAEPGVKHLGFVGDSTFFASGITGLANAVYNQAPVTLCVLDNSITAMTGSQPHPGTGMRMSYDATNADAQHALSIPQVIKALGVTSVQVLNPFELSNAIEAIKRAIDEPGVNALVFEAPCIKVSKAKAVPTVKDGCNGCGVCIQSIGCPALVMNEKTNKVHVDAELCYGCDLCIQICPFSALESNNA